jgi:retinol dehydrogenase-12
LGLKIQPRQRHPRSLRTSNPHNRRQVTITPSPIKANLNPGSNGLGKESALQLSKHNATVYITSRSPSKGQVAIADIKSQVSNANLHVLQLDLASLSSVATAAKQFLSLSPRLDILMLNAGIMAPPPGLTEDGYEIQFGTNYLGHALFTQLLLPLLLSTTSLPAADVRIITLTSSAHTLAPAPDGIVFSALKTPQEEETRLAKYGQSKLANLLHTKSLHKGYGGGDKGIKCVAVHPGMADTGLANSYGDMWGLSVLERVVGWVMAVSVQEGARGQVWAATAREVVGGAYYIPVGKWGRESVQARNGELAEWLWVWMEGELKGWV